MPKQKALRTVGEKKRKMIKFTSCHLIMKQISEQISQERSQKWKNSND